jgi:hypothetical protein
MGVFKRECNLLRIELSETQLDVVLDPHNARRMLKLAIPDREASRYLRAALSNIWYDGSDGIAILSLQTVFWVILLTPPATV